MASSWWLILITGACAFAGVPAPDSSLTQNLSDTLAGPSNAHLLDNVDLDRDALSLLLHSGGGLLAIA